MTDKSLYNNGKILDLDDLQDEPWCGWESTGGWEKGMYDHLEDEVKQDDGLTAKHYELPEGCTELKHLIWFKDMNAQIGEAFRSLYRLDECVHSNRRRDLNKVKAYIDQELERMDIYE
jgi:hypothetical protein